MRSNAIFILPLLALGCGGRDRPDNQPPPLQPIEKNSALEAANRNFRNVVVGGARSGQFAEDNRLIGGLFGSGSSSSGGSEQTMEARANEMADDLAARVLNVANVEVEEEKRIVLMLKPEVACASASSTAAPDQSCLMALTQVPVRLELTTRHENDIDAALTVGTYAVATAQFYTDRFALELDFGALLDAAKALEAASGEPMEQIEGSLRGRIRIELLVNGPNDYTLSLSILSPIDFDATVNGEPLTLDIGTSSPLASVRIDGNTPKLVFESNVGLIQMSVPLNAIVVSDGNGGAPAPEPSEPATLGIRVEPTSAKVTIDTSETVKIDRYSTGGVSVTYNSLPLLSYSLNGGQAISAEIASDDLGTTFSVSPMLDVRMQFDMTPIADRLDSDYPTWLLSDTISLMLNGAPSPAIRTRTIEETTTDPNGNTTTTEKIAFEVVSGRLTLSSSAAGKTVVVEAGMCLDAMEPDPNATEQQHPFELLYAGTCE